MTAEREQAEHYFISYSRRDADFVQRFADDLRREAGPDPADQVALGLWRVTQREPTAADIERGVRLIAALQGDEGTSSRDALRYFCLVALNLNEFMYLD